MLRFIHLQLQHYLRPGSFEIYATDTDSCILGVSMSGNDLWNICKPELLEVFDQRYADIFVTNEEDSLKPLLLKLEQEGQVFVGLASKTYHLANDEGTAKVACKGISHTLENINVLRLENYLSTVFDMNDEENNSAKQPVVRGIRSDKDHQWMRTYKQTKKGLRRFCPKVGYFKCGICNFPRELKDEKRQLRKLYPFMDKDCSLSYDSVLAHIEAEFPLILRMS